MISDTLVTGMGKPLERVLHQLNDIKRYSPPGQPNRQKQLSTLTDDKVQNGEDNN